MPQFTLPAFPGTPRTCSVPRTATEDSFCCTQQHSTTWRDTAQHCGTVGDSVTQPCSALFRPIKGDSTARDGGVNPTDILGDRETCESMDDQLVIAAVAAHRSLYDPSHIKYKDVELRNAIWQKIAGDLKMEGWYRLLEFSSSIR